MITDDQQSVSMISEDTDSQVDTETDHAYNNSSDQEAIMDILCPFSILIQTQMKMIAYWGLNDQTT